MTSVQLIPGRKKIVTLLRDPVARLLSLYYFQRAHKPDVIERENLGLARFATRYTLNEFFGTPEVRIHPAINNSMTRVMAGILECSHAETPGWAAEIGAGAHLDVAIRQLKNIAAFGITERFAESQQLIARAIGLNITAKVQPKQVLDKIVDEEPGLRRIERESPTEKTRELIADLVRTDVQLYQYASAMFDERLAALS
jgi:hypothetical protein